MRKSAKIDFSRVALSDHFLRGFIGQALVDGIATGISNEGVSHLRRSRFKQPALALLVLFDRLIAPIFEGTWFENTCIDRLEGEGILEIVRPDPKELGLPDESSPNYNMISFQLVEEFHPFVLHALMKSDFGEDQEGKRARKSLGISRRRYYSQIIDLCSALVEEDIDKISRSDFTRLFGFDGCLEYLEKMYSEKIRVNGKVHMFRLVSTAAAIHATRLNALRAISTKYQIGIASHKYHSGTAGWKSASAFKSEYSEVPRAYGLLRFAMKEEGLWFPKINNIYDALKLRKDPNVNSFRIQLSELHKHVAAGDRESVIKLRREIRTAVSHLKFSRTWEKCSDWVTYIALPATVIEAIYWVHRLRGQFYQYFLPEEQLCRDPLSEKISGCFLVVEIRENCAECFFPIWTLTGVSKELYLPTGGRLENWGMGFGLAAAISSQQRLYGGLRVAIKRTSVFGLQDFSGSDWMIGFQYKLFAF